MSIIECFTKHYDETRQFYVRTAKAAELQCRQALEYHYIPAFITSRAKYPTRLREKLENRNTELQYQTEADIRSNICDLAGVRIAVYLPGHINKVARLLQMVFIPRLIKVYNSTYPRQGRSFEFEGSREHPKEISCALPGVAVQQITCPSGYRAIHLHMVLSSKTASDEDIPTGASLQVEIQIISLLMHAWSEVEHDLAYQCVEEEALSVEEASILKEINDSVAISESLLRRLEESMRARKAKQKRGLERL